MDLIPHPGILKAFGLREEDFRLQRFESGHINNTVRLRNIHGDRDYVLQRINTRVFTDPWTIVRNQRMAATFLKEHFPKYLFLAAIPTQDGSDLYETRDEFWRLVPFIPHSIALDQADSPKQAFEAATQFGRLTRLLSGIDLYDFSPTIPNFHNLTLRYSAFQDAIRNAREERREYAEELTESFLRYSFIAVQFEQLKTDREFRDRLVHHDTKINNVLLDEKSFEGICVIDLDTLMPGKIISDLGDMVRTYTSPVSEEEQDYSRIVIREPYYEALMKGYLSELGEDLTPTEKNLLFYAGQFMVYMQGIRFLTDFLNSDIYYPIRYPEHNFVRAKNQLTLLEQLNQKEKALRHIIDSCL
ncbi:MAG TPA: aminoglycoside phosphotransferase family protein [Chitinophagaceae bacterium]|nr:aminoglycoside phosphotransferase family protein [Chitinophagaceae bacterium]